MKYTKENLQLAVDKSNSIRQVLFNLGFKQITGSTSRHIKNRIKLFNIDITHFVHQPITLDKTKRHYNSILIRRQCGREKSNILRRALIESGVEYKCVKCGNNGVWNNEDLMLEVSHIDDNYLNNTAENLEFLCPNCHTLKTYNKFKNPTKKRKKPYIEKPNTRKVNRPSKEELEKLVWNKPVTHIAKDYNISDKAVEKWCKYYQINKPKRGYWTKKTESRP